MTTARRTTRKRTEPARRRKGAERRVMLATDFSPASEPATRAAVELAKLTGAEVIVFHALNTALVFIRDTELRRELWESLRAEALAQLRQRVAEVQRQGVPALGVLRRGEPRKEIIAAAERLHVDTIVMGTHGRTGLKRALVGSVAREVVNVSPIPVLTVRAPGAAKVGPAEPSAARRGTEPAPRR